MDSNGFEFPDIKESWKNAPASITIHSCTIVPSATFPFECKIRKEKNSAHFIKDITQEFNLTIDGKNAVIYAQNFISEHFFDLSGRIMLNHVGTKHRDIIQYNATDGNVDTLEKGIVGYTAWFDICYNGIPIAYDHVGVTLKNDSVYYVKVQKHDIVSTSMHPLGSSLMSSKGSFNKNFNRIKNEFRFNKDYRIKFADLVYLDPADKSGHRSESAILTPCWIYGVEYKNEDTQEDNGKVFCVNAITSEFIGVFE